MYLGELFRSFRPLHNPLGFGVADFVLLAFALSLTAGIVLRAALLPYVSKIARRTALAMAVIGGMSILLRLALLGSSPVPIPSGADDFSFVLLADTLKHFRLANQTHPLHHFFEAVFVLQQPAYSSIYPLGQGLVLALGRLVFGNFWAGVLISSAGFGALCYWMLRGWTCGQWAFVGAMLAVIQFGPLNAWTNSYWGGAVSACAGCLVFGALPRLRDALHSDRPRDAQRKALLVGLGMGLQLLTRPFECGLLAICVLLFCILCLDPRPRMPAIARSLAAVCLALCPAIGLTLLQNKRVTGDWATLPYLLSRYQYGVPATFTWQPNPVPHRALTPEQELDYRAQAAIHGTGTDSLRSYFERLAFRLRFLRFFMLAPLYFAVAFFPPSLRQSQWVWILASVAIFTAGTNFYPYFFPHYVAAITCLFVLIAVKGLKNLTRFERRAFPAGAMAARMLLLLSFAHFIFWYGLHFSGNPNLLPAAAQETWDFIDYGDSEGRIAVNNRLSNSPGDQLVFVRYSPQHRFAEWIGNAADIDASKIVWALDRGAAENKRLVSYFPSRTTWILQPDARPPKLTAYSDAANLFESVR